MVATSHAQGNVYFQNYTSALNSIQINAPVTFASSANPVTGGVGPSVAGHGVGKEFTAALLYSVGNTGTYTALTFVNSGATAQGAFGYPAAFAYGSGLDAAITAPPAGGNAGYFLGAGIKIPAYSSGTIAFIVEAYNGSDFASSTGAGLWRGQSAPFVLASIATGTTPTGYLVGMGGFTVTSVPEPTTIALAGLGLAALMAFRRKQV